MAIETKLPRGRATFTVVDVPRDEDLYKCVHCGLCLNVCPTYTELLVEPESPRGRIALMKAVSEGRLEMTPRVVSHWELCLQCRACEAICPSGVPYGRLMEHTRAQLHQTGRFTLKQRLVNRVMLRLLLPHQGRLRFLMGLLRLYQRSGLQWLVRKSRVLVLIPGPLKSIEAQSPTAAKRFFGPSAQVFPARDQKRARVAVLSGCIMPLVHANAMDATVRVLQRNGCEVVAPKGQGCCGALNAHGGDLEMARQMARRNIDVFLAANVDSVVVNSAGCGAAMKEYGELLRDDPAYHEKATRLAKMTCDVTEYLVKLPFQPPKAALKRRVTYQDACHLAHAQRIKAQPRQVLASIPGVEFVEMADSDRCCGAAGVYSYVHTDMAQRLLKSKVAAAAATRAEVVTTANPGCAMHIQAGLKRSGVDAEMRYVVELLDEAYRAEEA